jgi:hypothetical protein
VQRLTHSQKPWLSIQPRRYQYALSVDSPGPTGGAGEVALLVDFDNVFPPNKHDAESLVPEMNRWVTFIHALLPTQTLRIRLYGGWLDGGVMTKAASVLSAGIPRDFFPLAAEVDGKPSLIRGSVELATRLVGVPEIEWQHSFRTREGIPRLRLAQKPRPDGCINHVACPIDAVQRMSRNRGRICQHEGCMARNDSAFLLHEQKMVDALLSCDAIEFARRGTHIVVMSNDLDVLPSVATTAGFSKASVTLVRGVEAGDTDLYSEALKGLGVEVASLESS